MSLMTRYFFIFVFFLSFGYSCTGCMDSFLSNVYAQQAIQQFKNVENNTADYMSNTLAMLNSVAPIEAHNTKHIEENNSLQYYILLKEKELVFLNEISSKLQSNVNQIISK